MKLIFLLIIPIFVSNVEAKAQITVGSQPWQRMEVIRTEKGVPHIRAKDLFAAGFALAWLQLEDHGNLTGLRVLEASGRQASVVGYERIDSDFNILRQRSKALPKYPFLSKNVRDVYEGFAAGVNRFIDLHRSEFPIGMPSDFVGFDVLATELIQPSPQKIRNFLNRRSGRSDEDPAAMDDEGETPDDGSNAWALAPSRTRSGNTILLRNPHLRWTAGYYEAHLTVPGVIDFYGDFRIGGPFAVIGGFNRNLGFSTTNNAQDLDEIYELDADPKRPDHYLFDGKSVPIKRELITVPFRSGGSTLTETREFWTTALGPVIKRADGKIYVFKYAGDGEIRAGEQFLRMMRARTFNEWKAAMKMRARVTSNFTYADRAGNIYYLWNAALPLLPHPPVDELTAVAARGIKDVWINYVPFDALPQVLNPPGGYVHNENSSHHYTNVRMPIVTRNAYPNFEEPRLSLRSQLAIQLIGGDEKFSLEDIVRLKHSYRTLLADRVKDDLIAAVRATAPSGDVAASLSLIERWDNTTSPASRGSVVFQEWWRHYSGIHGEIRQALPDDKRYANVWTADDPLTTPRGLADPKRAAESFAWAVDEVKKRYGSFDVEWGDVHRVRRGKVDMPVGGCGNDLGCFRIMTFERDKDGKFAAVGGDCWVLVVEFDVVPKAYSVLAYGQGRLPSSPYHDDQAEMFAKGELKRVAFTKADVDAQAIVRYRPGERSVR
ncbi:MAG: penicillin acylase family protein [Blastocatellia bacterium]|nr:penicillin acylase family protein [Blastocatellia bacterium]